MSIHKLIGYKNPAEFKGGQCAIGALLIGMLGTGCLSLADSGKVTTLPASTHPPSSPTPETFTYAPTAWASEQIVPTETVQPSPPIPTSVKAIMPITTSALVRTHGFSPDGTLLAYWMISNEPQVGFDDPAGHLYFLNVNTNETCLYPEIVGYHSRLVWEADGNVVVVSPDFAKAGLPCQENFAIVVIPPVTDNISDPALSPGGVYRASTLVKAQIEGVLILETQIITHATNQIQNTITWKIDERIGEIGLSGQWLSRDQFLIWETLDQGPLLITVGKGVAQVAPDLFGLPAVPVERDLVTLKTRGAAIGDAQMYHIVLSGGSGSNEDFPLVQIYHSETGATEVLPFMYMWEPVFSADGRWLLFDERPLGSNGRESHALWVRSIDPVGGQPHLIDSGNLLNVSWSPNWTKVASGDLGRISILTFPEGIQKVLWSTGNYAIIPRAWSPDGEFLAIEGYIPGAQQQALYVVPVP